MQEIEITKEAASLLHSLHKSYKKRIRKGMLRQEAALFGDPSDILKEISSDRSLGDIEDACWELYDAELIHGTPGDDKLLCISLTKLGIIHAQAKAAGAIKSAWAFIKDLLPFIS